MGEETSSMFYRQLKVSKGRNAIMFLFDDNGVKVDDQTELNKSSDFIPSVGVFSPYLFVLCIEALSRKLRETLHETRVDVGFSSP